MENQVVDALSRRAHETHNSTINMYVTDLKEKCTICHMLGTQDIKNPLQL
jgi:hypothetical protein